MLHRSEKRPFSKICQGHNSKTARHTWLKICIFVSTCIVNVYKRAKFKTTKSLKQIGGGHRKNGQKSVDLMWNDQLPYNDNNYKEEIWRHCSITIAGAFVVVGVLAGIPALSLTITCTCHGHGGTVPAHGQQNKTHTSIFNCNTLKGTTCFVDTSHPSDSVNERQTSRWVQHVLHTSTMSSNVQRYCVQCS